MNDASDQDIDRSLIRNRYRKAACERYGGGFGGLWKKKRWRIVYGGGSSDALRSNTRIRRRQTRKRKR